MLRKTKTLQDQNVNQNIGYIINQLDTFFKAERNWKCVKKVQMNNGEKTFYYCNVAGRGRNRCPAKLSAFKPTNSPKTVLETAGHHVHEEGKFRMTPKVYKKIEEYVNLGMKLRAISHEIRTNPRYTEKPSKNQVGLCVCFRTNRLSKCLFWINLISSNVCMYVLCER